MAMGRTSEKSLLGTRVHKSKKRKGRTSRSVFGSGATGRDSNSDSVGPDPREGKAMNQGDLGDLANLDTQTLLQHLPGVRFPAEKEQVAATAEQNDAPQELVQKIRNADTQRFNGPDEVLEAVQGR
jgi:hypothetical protein